MERRQKQSYTPSQCLLCFITLSTLLTLISCVALGIVLYVNPGRKWIWFDEKYFNNGGDYVVYPGIGLFVGAIVTLVASIVGCCAVCKDSKYALLTFSILFSAAALLYVASSIILFIFEFVVLKNKSEFAPPSSHEIIISTTFGVTLVLAFIQIVTSFMGCYGTHIIWKYEQYDIL